MHSRFKVLKWNATSIYIGMDAITLFKNTGFAHIDVVLIEADMPAVDGKTAAATLLEMGCKKPIIALTSNDYFDEGAAAVVGKTLRHPILVDMILHADKFNITPEENLELLQTVCSHLISCVNSNIRKGVHISFFRHGLSSIRAAFLAL